MPDYINDVSDDHIKKLEKKFKEANKVTARVLGCKHADGIATTSLKRKMPAISDTVHGKDGLGNTCRPKPKTKKIEKSACEFLVDTVSEHPGEVTILDLGTLTNIALVARHLIAAGHHVHIVIGAPDFVFTSEINSPNLFLRKVLLDCGAVQADALTIDRLAYLEKDHEVEKHTGDGSVDMYGRAALKSNKGNWRACPFILGMEICERLAYYGISKNLVTCLTTKFHQGTATAAKNVTTWSGTCFLTPLLGALLADSYWGRYWTIAVFSSIYVIVESGDEN